MLQSMLRFCQHPPESLLQHVGGKPYMAGGVACTRKVLTGFFMAFL